VPLPKVEIVVFERPEMRYEAILHHMTDTVRGYRPLLHLGAGLTWDTITSSYVCDGVSQCEQPHGASGNW
jgi:hypothetical protein